MKYTQDFYALKAKNEGYSARSVYKLQEIHHKYLHKLAHAKRVLDLGAAPGSWTQYIQKKIPSSSEIVAIDLQPLSAKLQATPTVIQIEADFTQHEIIERIISDAASKGKFDFVLSDAAPFTSGNKGLDTARSENLVEITAHIALQVLAEGGVMVAKLFQGSGMNELLAQLKQDFSKVACMRPKAVKSASFETYLICS